VKWSISRRRLSADQRLDLELRDHIERQVADYVASGLSEADARRRVRLELGGLDQAKEECRDVRPLQWLDELVRDVRVGFRSLSRDRLFAASVTIILALGIGTSVTMFSVLNAVVLRPLPYARPGELARLSTYLIRQDQFDGTSMANFLDWRQQSRSFASMTFYRRTSVSAVTFAGTDAPQRAQEGLIGPEFFELLGAAPLIGRTFSREEFERRERVVVLSERLWQEQFGRSHALRGQTLLIGGESHVVVGVMPRTFQLPTNDTRIWRPYSILPEWPAVQSIRDSDQIEVLGRLASGVRLQEASAEMGVIAARLREAHAVNRNIDIRVTSLFDHVVGSRTRRGVWLGFAAVLSLLLIACANVGGLLSARAAKRRRELALRSALGAGRARLVRQLLAEGVSLWAMATVAGVLLAYGLIRLLLAYGPRTLPRMEEVGLDFTALAVAFLGGLGVVTVCGTIPALTAAKTDATAAFGTRDQSSLRRHGLQHLLVTGQIAGTVVLLVVAVLLAQSFIRAQREDPGYPAENLLIVRIDLPRAAYADRPALAGFFREAKDRIGRLPGVVSVGGITDFFIRRNAGQWVTVDGRAAEQHPDSRLAIEGVTPGYFRAMGIDVLEGRDFEERDYEPGAPGVFIVSETLARRFWPGESAVGKRVVSGTSPPKDGRWSTVVGVVKDIRREGLDVAPILLGFVPAFLRGMDMTIHASTGAQNLIPSVRQEIRAIDSSLPIPSVVTANQRLSERIGGRRFETQVTGTFAGIALLLSAAGLYALLAYQVALRTREIGIRSALGAHRWSIVTMILGEGIRLALTGATLGVVGAAAAARIVQSLLYDTAAINAPSYAAVAAFVLLVAATAAWLPARRAAGVSPMTALRED
jgi:macrolide transport system ATP-binding/permease protein